MTSCLKDKRWLDTSECETWKYKNLVPTTEQCQQPVKTWRWSQLIKGAHPLLSVPLALNRGCCSVCFKAPLSTSVFHDWLNWCHVKRLSVRDPGDPKSDNWLHKSLSLALSFILQPNPSDRISRPQGNMSSYQIKTIFSSASGYLFLHAHMELRSTLGENNYSCGQNRLSTDGMCGQDHECVIVSLGAENLELTCEAAHLPLLTDTPSDRPKE